MNNYPERKVQNPNNPTAVWAKELLEDEIAGQKKPLSLLQHGHLQNTSEYLNRYTYTPPHSPAGTTGIHIVFIYFLGYTYYTYTHE